MKKLSIFLLGALAFAATSCEDGPSEVPVQSNPQGPVLEVAGVVAEQSTESAAVVLKDYADAGTNIPVANVTLTDFPEGYNLKMVAQLSKDESFAKYGEMPVAVADGIASITPDDFQNAYVTTVSKSPAAKDVYVRYAVYAVKGENEVLRIGGPDHYLGAFKMNVTPFPSDFVIEQNYYLIGTACDWQMPQAIKFNHSDKDAYDDPVFTLVVNITEDQAASGWWWKIVPESTFNTGDWVSAPYAQFGPAENGSEDMEGVLMAMTKNEDGTFAEPGAGSLYEAGPYMITIDMIEGTYSFSLAIENFYTPGTSNGWNFDACQLMYTNDYMNYFGYINVVGEFKFTNEAGWGGAYNLGAGSEPGVLVKGSNDNLKVAADGLYYMTLNLPNLTYTSTLIETIGIIGDATPGGWDASTALTPSADNLVWEADVEFGATGEWKFRANNDWAINLGGALDNLVQDGGNLPTPGAGKKHIRLDLSTHPYTVTVQ